MCRHLFCGTRPENGRAPSGPGSTGWSQLRKHRQRNTKLASLRCAIRQKQRPRRSYQQVANTPPMPCVILSPTSCGTFVPAFLCRTKFGPSENPTLKPAHTRSKTRIISIYPLVLTS